MRKPDARKVRLATAAAACLAAIASAPLALTTLSDNGIVLPGVNSAERLMAMLDARSPGEREKGALFQTKIRAAGVDKPRERALGKTFPPKPSPAEQLAKVIVPAPPVVPVDVVPPIIPPAVADVLSPGGLVSGVPLTFGAAIVGGGGGIGGGGGGGGGGTPPGSETPPPPVTSAVPEPSSWLMMLFGFGAIGSAMRRRPRRALVSA